MTNVNNTASELKKVSLRIVELKAFRARPDSLHVLCYCTADGGPAMDE